MDHHGSAFAPGVEDAILNAMDDAHLKDMGDSLYEDDGDGSEPTGEDY
ncbi:hypothetical protein [Actinacidiphila acididurans]|uniref:Uncharacterized protein n=1 Tax=Actinacidiphila acididurans TaxID=2784346 RepID=A0ABS2TXC0_9ACTN|nr:hypothetical protein [Actinacidiphila acididurans]MBM9507979.1 hypothetical protein [Actinacidiphila acididurans]